MRTIGANYTGSKCTFDVWAPFAKKVELEVVHPFEEIRPMEEGEDGYWHMDAVDIYPSVRYFYLVDGKKFPDPASLSQPEGVHGPSEVVNHGFEWEDDEWQVPALHRLLFYEVHPGTFSQEGTFTGILKCLPHLKQTGINAISLMPVAQFPGARNWGYDGVYPFAVQNSYGGVYGLKTLVNECHKQGIAVFLDVVYNHFGPEGNYVENFAPYFTSKYKTPWGKAINFDDAHSDEVRNYFLNNALHWFEQFHIDGLRLDAVHAIHDESAYPFLRELSDVTEACNRQNNRKHYLIAESGLNDTRIIRSKEQFGHGLNAHWLDDFHHAIHAWLTGERNGYYADYGEMQQVLKSLRNGYVLDGIYSKHRRRRHGESSENVPSDKFLIYVQNHDQTGNRQNGERLIELVPKEACKTALALMMFSPYMPMLFMGEEYGETNPFLYFVDHSDPHLIESVRRGRRREFKSFGWKGKTPDPDDPKTFEASRLDWSKLDLAEHQRFHQFMKAVISLRYGHPVLSSPDKFNMKVESLFDNKGLSMRRWKEGHEIMIMANLSDQSQEIERQTGWNIIFDTAKYQVTDHEEVNKYKNNEKDKTVLPPYQLKVYEKKNEEDDR